ncbi:MAG: AmmeMemoRadiSam system protein B [Actinomycetota bacterium]|nr:AmmeMemoRadiSam system protein B [Actinomycetota bacterium]
MKTLRTRRPAVAGSFYPAEPEVLRRAVEGELQRAAGSAGTGPDPVAVVVPHAGYRYSGPVAASAYARLLPWQGRTRRVVLLGSAHHSPATAVAVTGADAFETPLGLASVDREVREELVTAGLAVDDEAHATEHSVEVQLPFLQVTLGSVPIVPLVVGTAPAPAVAAVLDAVWSRPETLVVVSTDLSHYHDLETAQRIDRRTADAAVGKRPDAIGADDACGAFALRGLLVAARRRGLDVQLLDLRTSADTAGTPDSVVGYAAFALYPPG